MPIFLMFFLLQILVYAKTLIYTYNPRETKPRDPEIDEITIDVSMSTDLLPTTKMPDIVAK